MTPDTFWNLNYVSRASEHFSTPLSLPIGSGLAVKLKDVERDSSVVIHIIGRLVTL